MDSRNTKIKAESEESGQSSTAAAVVLVQQTGDIFKLDIDCFEEVYDFLPLRDLVSAGETCKRLQGVAGYCFQQNYDAINIEIRNNGVYLWHLWFKHYSVKLDCFIPFINRIFFYSEASLEFFRREQSKFVRLKQITFGGLIITSKQIDCVIDKLNNVEILQIVHCAIERFLHGTLLNFCINLKRLIIIKTPTYEHNWMLNKYPKLEYFEYLPTTNSALNQLSSFFKLNPTVRMFATNINLVWNNSEVMTSGRVRLDDLAIFVEDYTDCEYRKVYQFLNELHDHGVYKRLHVYFDFRKAPKDMIYQITTLASLIKLHIKLEQADRIQLPILNNLQEILIYRPRDIINFEDLASEFPSLQRVHLREATSTDLLMFISRTVNLMKIRVYRLSTGRHFDEDDKILDLVALNKERRKLNEAEKCIIYVMDDIYLATKWAMKGTDLSYIVMRRAESHDWKHSFFHKFY